VIADPLILIRILILIRSRVLKSRISDFAFLKEILQNRRALILQNTREREPRG
jgi:hypothetical protein